MQTGRLARRYDQVVDSSDAIQEFAGDLYATACTLSTRHGDASVEKPVLGMCRLCVLERRTWEKGRSRRMNYYFTSLDKGDEREKETGADCRVKP